MRIVPVVGFPRYFIREDGRLFSAHGRRDYGRERHGDMQEVLGAVNGRGYRMAWLCQDGGRSLKTFHALVAQAFLPTPEPDQKEIRHLDGVKLNNAVSNLAWGTSAENKADSIRHGVTPVGSRSPLAKLTDEAVTDIKRRLAMGESTTAIAERYGVTQANVSCIATGQTWKHVPNPVGFERRRVRGARPVASTEGG